MNYCQQSIRWAIGVLLAAGLVPSLKADKIKIEKKDDLPRYTYKIDVEAVDLYASDDALMKLAREVERDLLADLDKYEIADETTLQEYYANLGTIAILRGDWQAYLDYLDKRKKLEEKEANRLTKGMVGVAIARAKMAGDAEHYRENVRAELAQAVRAMPYDVVQDNLKSSKGSAEIISRNLLLGVVAARIQPMLDESDGTMSQDVARGLVGRAFTFKYYLPIKDVVHDVLASVIDANRVDKPDIWAARDFTVQPQEGKADVVLAVWDSGVDTKIFEKTNQLWTNANEVPDNGKDDDGNGFVDDVHGIAYSLHSEKEIPILFPIGELAEDEDVLRRQMKGLTDIKAAVDSAEATEVRARLAALQQDKVRPFIEQISLYGNYCHGTHVAGISAKGNPYAKILVSRLTFDHKMIPEEPTVELAEAEARALREAIDYYQQNGVRVVNMSWGGSLRSIEAALEANNAGGTPQERKALARKIFSITDEAFRQAMQNAAEILFVTSAGNADNDVAFEEFYPSSYDYPNILSVGAVDQAGDETSFTSFGKVDCYGNGFEVASYVPGGQELKLNGTSMSSPQVTNLAGKLLAIKPDLSVAELRQLILDGCDDKQAGERTVKLINPKKSLELLNRGGGR